MFKTFIESFVDRDDAYNYLDDILTEYEGEYYPVYADIMFINRKWRVGIVLERSQRNLFEELDYTDMNDVVD